MNITVICIGKLKEKYWRDAIAEYSKRLGGYCSLKIDEKAVMNVTETEEGNVRILRAVADKETIARTLDSVIDGTYCY